MALAGDNQPERRSSPCRSMQAEFQSQVELCRHNDVGYGSFVLWSQLRAWLDSRNESRDLQTRAQALFAGSLAEARFEGLPVAKEENFQASEAFLKNFSILLATGSGCFIGLLIEHAVAEQDLPFSKSQLDDIFDRTLLPDARERSVRFFEYQWQFCPAKLELGGIYEFSDLTVIPIAKWTEINRKGGTARVRKVQIPKEFIGNELRNATSSANSPESNSENPSVCMRVHGQYNSSDAN
jgi:hypothetical protein